MSMRLDTWSKFDHMSRSCYHRIGYVSYFNHVSWPYYRFNTLEHYIETESFLTYFSTALIRGNVICRSRTAYASWIDILVAGSARTFLLYNWKSRKTLCQVVNDGDKEIPCSCDVTNYVIYVEAWEEVWEKK